MKTKIETTFLLIGVLIFSHTVSATLTVISDKGGEPIDAYLEKLNKKEETTKHDIGKLPVPKAIKNFNPDKNRYPIETPELTPGKVKNHQLEQKPPVSLGVQFAIVGYDKYSWKWLQKNRTRFEKTGTTILVVNVKTPKQLQAIRDLMSKNAVDAVPGSDIAKQLQLKHYPVLISDKGVTQ